MHVIVLVIVLTLLILLNAGFALAEMALVSSRKAALALFARKGVSGAARARALAETPERFLPTVQVGITAISVLTGVVGGAQLAQSLAPAIALIRPLAPLANTLALAITV
ncbi:MAG: hemolysin C, partial [Acidiphilium sp. 21-68-69]